MALNERYNNQLNTAPWKQTGTGWTADVKFKKAPSELELEKLVEYSHKHGGRLEHSDSRWTGQVDPADGLCFWFGEEGDAKAFVSELKHIASFKGAEIEHVWVDPAGGLHYGDEDPTSMYEMEMNEAKAYDKQSWEHVKVGERFEIGPVSMALNPDNPKNRAAWPKGAGVQVEAIENGKVRVRLIRPDGSLATVPKTGDTGGFKWMDFDMKAGPKIIKMLASAASSQTNTGAPTFESMTREHLLAAIEFRPVNVRLADGSLKTITKAEEVSEDLVFESIEEVYPDGFDELSERVVVKRKYGASPEVTINTHGPLRNDVLEFVGNKFVTEGELQAFFNKLDEERGKKLNYRKWFNENQKFFESYTLKGTKVWSLSKIGKRAFEHVMDRRSGSNPISERTVLGYDEFILNEELSVIEEAVDIAAQVISLANEIGVKGDWKSKDPEDGFLARSSDDAKKLVSALNKKKIGCNNGDCFIGDPVHGDEEKNGKLVVIYDLSESVKVNEAVSDSAFINSFIDKHGKDEWEGIGAKVDLKSGSETEIDSVVSGFLVTSKGTKIKVSSIADSSLPKLRAAIESFMKDNDLSESIKTPVKQGTVQKVIELALKHLKPKVTEDEVVKQLAGVMSLEDLYDKAVKLVSPADVASFEKAFPMTEGLAKSYN